MKLMVQIRMAHFLTDTYPKPNKNEAKLIATKNASSIFVSQT